MLQLLQMHSGGTSPKGDQPSAEAKVLKAEENASRLAASFMMKAAVTKALHEEQASIVQMRSFCNYQNPIMSRHTTSQAPFVSCGSGSLKAIYSDIVLFVALLNKHHGLHNTPMANRFMSQKHQCKHAKSIAAT